jgi:hypothetical protein
MPDSRARTDRTGAPGTNSTAAKVGQSAMPALKAEPAVKKSFVQRILQRIFGK